jgi:protein-disulfide isomerase
MTAFPARPGLRSLITAAVLLPLALGVAACGKKAAAPAENGAPIARIAPPAGKAWSDQVAVTPEGGYRMGNPNAPIKLVEFGSLTCSHCAEFNAESDADMRGFVDSGRVSFEFRNFVRDPIDMTTAMLVRCGAPESYFGLTHEAMANQTNVFDKIKSSGDAAYQQAMALPPAQRFGALARLTGLDTFFAERGLPKAKADACLANSATADTLAKSTEEVGQKLEIDSTPTFLFNGEKGPPATWADVKQRLQAMGAR